MGRSINRQETEATGARFTYKETVRTGRCAGGAVSPRLLQSTESPLQVQFRAQGGSEANAWPTSSSRASIK